MVRFLQYIYEPKTTKLNQKKWSLTGPLKFGGKCIDFYAQVKSV